MDTERISQYLLKLIPGERARLILLRILKTILHALVGAFVVLLILGIYYLNGRAELSIWHTVRLDAEFTASSPIDTFPEYLDLEDRLFAQLDEEVYAKTETENQRGINRYRRGSPADPELWPINWNRSYELSPSSAIQSGVLLIHGMSDSPYSLRSLGLRLQESGCHVIGLRVPGHGTAPSGLTRVTYKDMAAAVTLAMKHLRSRVPDKPIYIVGYSNGAALAVHYSLSVLEEPELPTATGLILLSPEIGVSPVAALAIWQERIGRTLGLGKLGWNDILPEYDPFKYSSFAVNAGKLAHNLTGINRSKIARLSEAKKLHEFPPVLAFQSAVDSTVSAPALVRDLFARLPDHGHELVLFDLNRMVEIETFLKSDPKDHFPVLLENPDRSYTFSLLTNKSDDSSELVWRRAFPGETVFTDSDPRLVWPPGIYSLSHVAMPFSGNDPLYGGDNPGSGPGLHLGSLAMRGENGVLKISPAHMLRLRWNPFYDFLEDRVIERIGEEKRSD